MTGVRTDVGRAFALAALRLTALFALVFYGAEWLTAWRATRWPLYFAWELSIPYWPLAYLVYYSVFGVPFLVLWRAHEASQVRQWERRMRAAILVAGATFLLLPAEAGYGPADAGAWRAWAQFTQVAAGRYNLLPSLHVALSLVTLLTVWPLLRRPARLLLLAWFALLLPSVLLTHQHHVLDVLAGAALAFALARCGRATP